MKGNKMLPKFLLFLLLAIIFILNHQAITNAQGIGRKVKLFITLRDFRGFLPMEDGGKTNANKLLNVAGVSVTKPANLPVRFHPHFDNQHFSATSGNNSFFTSSNNAPVTNPLITSLIEPKLAIEAGSGIRKPVYCAPEKRLKMDAGRIPVCGAPKDTSNTKTTFGKSPDDDEFAEFGFFTWYHDHYVPAVTSQDNNTRFNNKRSGSVIELQEVGSVFQFSSKKFFPISTAGVAPWDEVDDRFGGEGNTNGTDRTVHLNYGFTTELHTFFEFQRGQVFTFEGDDDVWVFIEDDLALDLGGLHPPMNKTLNLDAFSASLATPLIPGNVYSLSMFHAERHTEGSNFRIDTTIVAPCNAVEEGVEQIRFPIAQFNVSEYKLIGSTVLGSNNSAIFRLNQQGLQNRASYIFFRVKQNLKAGFVSNFTFQAKPQSEGFAFVIQDDRLQDFNGGFGSNLGVQNFKKSIAVIFDLCTIRPATCSATSRNGEIRVISNPTNDFESVQQIANATLHKGASFADDLPYNVVVQYLFNPPVFEVYVDQSLYIQLRNFDIETILGSSTGFMGFTSSTGDLLHDGEVLIRKWNVDTVSIKDSATRLNTNVNVTQVIPADERTRARFIIQNVDTCNNTVEFGGFDSRVSARFIQNNSAQGISIPAIVIDLQNGSYSVELETKIVGDFDLDLFFGENCEALPANCFVRKVPKAVTTTPLAPPLEELPPSDGISPAAITGLGIGIGALVILGSISGFILYRNRKRWLREKKFIEEGRMAKLNQGVVMSGNESLEKVAIRLQETREEINRRKAANLNGGADLSDDIAKLEAQKNDLQKALKDMKMQNQNFRDTSQPLFTNPAPPVPRKAFSPANPLDV